MCDNTPRGRMVVGSLLIGAGALFLLINLGWLSLDLSRFWPVFPLGVGLVFLSVHAVDGTRDTLWAVVPGTIITNVGLILFLIAFNLVDMGVFWPIFPLGVGLAFLEMYALGIREGHWPLYPGTILTLLGIIFFITTHLGWRWWPLLLIIAGFITFARRD